MLQYTDPYGAKVRVGGKPILMFGIEFWKTAAILGGNYSNESEIRRRTIDSTFTVIAKEPQATAAISSRPVRTRPF